MRSSRWTAAVAGLVALAVATVLMSRGGRSGAEAAPLRLESVDQDAAVPVEVGARTTLADAWLHVCVEGPEIWSRAGTLRVFSSVASGAPGTWASPAATAPFLDGVGRVRVAAGTWTWLSVESSAPSSPVALARVDPFVGTRELQVVLADRAALHVLVWSSDGAAPAADVEVLAEQVASDRGASCVTRGRTDAFGHARLVDVPDGYATVRTNVATVVDVEPYARKVSVAGKSPIADQVVTLLLPRPRQPLSLDVRVTSLPRDLTMPPRLFLRDAVEGKTVPVVANLQQGSNRLQTYVEAGDYYVDVLPWGYFTVNVLAGTVHVGGGDPAPTTHVVLVHNPARTMLQLEGVDAGDMPLRVTLRDPTQPLVPAEDLMFFGPLRWHVPSFEVPSVSSPVQLVVFTRRRTLTSRSTVRIEGGMTRVALVPACRTEIVWTTAERPRHPLVAVRNAGPVLLVPLRLELSCTDSDLVYRAEVVVPQGEVVLDCADGASALWRRTVALVDAVVKVDV